MGTWNRPGHGVFRRVSARLLVITSAAALLSAAAAATGAAADTPAGFWYGTDSRTITIPGPTPYREPVLGGPYGGYIGMTGNWANLAGCHKIVVWSAINSAQANTNFGTKVPTRRPKGPDRAVRPAQGPSVSPEHGQARPARAER